MMSVPTSFRAQEETEVSYGEYDQYIKAWLELEENQMKMFHWRHDQIVHTDYTARCGSTTPAQQAQIKENTENDGIGTDREGCEQQDTVISLPTTWRNPSTCHYGVEVHKRWALHPQQSRTWY